MILNIAEDAYSSCRYYPPDDWCQRTHFDRVIRRLDFTSSPGYPYCLEASSIGEWLGWDGMTMDQMKVERLHFDVERLKIQEYDVLYRVFIKREPHKKSKADSKRWRLIICPPLCEQVLWTMMFGPGNDREIATVGQTPSYQGMKLCGGDWKQYMHLFANQRFDVGLDKTAWDWTAHIEWIWLDLELRHRLIAVSAENKSYWLCLAQELYKGAFVHPKLILSSGLILEQVEPGIMKSGCVNTISSNSHMQVFPHILLNLRAGRSTRPLPAAVGDDTLSRRWNTPSKEEFASVGVLVKDLDDDLQFVGHVIDLTGKNGPVPAYRTKHLYRFCEIPPSDMRDFLDSMVRLYAHVPQYQRLWRTLARRYSLYLPSEEYVKFWYDYPTSEVARELMHLLPA